MAARPLRIAILAIVAFAVGLLLARLLVPAKPALPATERATVLAPARELPPLSLTDIDGRPLGSDFFAGHWTVVFFGFTTCPDVCPTTLATLAQFTKALTDLPEAQRPRVLLVTVDPERDDPAKLAAYVRFFDPSFLGATGDLAGVTAASCDGVRRPVRESEPARGGIHDGPRIGSLHRGPGRRHRRVLVFAA